VLDTRALLSALALEPDHWRVSLRRVLGTLAGAT